MNEIENFLYDIESLKIDANKSAELLKLVRSKCCDGPDFQLACVAGNVHVHVMDLVRSDGLNGSEYPLAFQALCNMVTCNEEVSLRVWSDIMPRLPLEFIWTASETRVPLYVFVLNSIKNVEQNRERLLENSILCNAILLHANCSTSIQIRSGIVEELCRSERWCEVLTSIIQDSDCLINYGELIAYQFEHGSVDSAISTCCAILSIETRSSAAEVHQFDVITSLHYLLVREEDATLDQSLDLSLDNCKSIIEALVCFLRRFSKRNAVLHAFKMNSDPTSYTADKKFGVKRNVLMLLANILPVHRELQDFMREIEGLALILDHCNIDDMNPYMKEWSIFCLRNLCRDNKENQRYIDQLKMQAPVQSLQSEGIQLDISADKDGVLLMKPVNN